MSKSVNYAEFLGGSIIKEGDTENVMHVRLMDADFHAEDLTGATITWSLAVGRGLLIESQPAVIVGDAADGVVEIRLLGGEPVGWGMFLLQFKVTREGSPYVEKYPADSSLVVIVTRSHENLVHTPASFASLETIKAEMQAQYDAFSGGVIEGAEGVGLSFTWDGTRLGVKREDEALYVYTELMGAVGPQGIQGIPGADGTGVEIKGSLVDVSELPLIGNAIGDAYLIGGDMYIWKGDLWENAGRIQGPDGLPGEPGPQGLQGPTGLTGPQGETGLTGPAGIQGLQGETGLTGSQGLQGDTGLTGPQGLQGLQGLQGIQGDVGPAGPQGLQGIQGLTGLTGLQGSVGVDGPTGPQGLQGLQGIQGDIGPAGIQGETGLQGLQGLQGVQGIQGETGLTGPQGLQGIQGETGLTGPAGIQGEQGLQGFKGDAGDTGLQGIQGIQGLTGDTGLTGPAGIQGIQGDIGPAGPQGLQGIQGLTGATGLTGDVGAVGPQGIQGIQGIQGVAGADGTGVEILGSLTNVSELPTSGNTIGDAYLIDGDMYIWKGTMWENAGRIQGPAGPQGLQGDVGPAGPQGLQGEVGLTGLTGLTGPAGPQGETGLQGLQGIQGFTGETGSTGAQGIQGLTGLTGPIGPAGEQGLQGLQGIQGLQGDIGPAGPQGLQGIQGESGLQGIQGLQGLQGIQGETGLTGPAGIQGETGLQGLQGIQGLTGETGLTGPAGIQGEQGLQGAQGLQGIQGETGLTGPAGIQGLQGETGSAGPQGVGGNSAYAVAVANGFIGTEAAWLASLEGERGLQGIQGIQGDVGPVGPQGLQGDTGLTGSQGIQGLTGDTGPQGLPGDTGLTGAVGPQGIQGETGPQGVVGDSAYAVAVANGFVGTPSAWLASLEGAQGIQGIQGIQGLTGATGATGEQGIQGLQGDVGPAGPQGLQGIQGIQGNAGSSLYTWVKYADTPTTGMSDLPTSKAYIGIAVNKMTLTESDTYADYEWSLILGPQGLQGIQGLTGDMGLQGLQGIQGEIGLTGPQGIQGIQGLPGDTGLTGPAGIQGEQGLQGIQGVQGETGLQGIQGIQGVAGASLYTWIKYADTPTTGMSDAPTDKAYMGIAVNKTSATESATYADYAWSLILGSGVAGESSFTNIKDHPSFDPMDISIAINDLILTTPQNHTLFLGSGEYSSKRINFTSNKVLKLVIEGRVNLIVDDSLFLVKNIRTHVIELTYAYTSVLNSRVFDIQNSFHGTYNLLQAINFSDGFVLRPNFTNTVDAEGVQYCNFKFQRLELNRTAIHFAPGTYVEPWINENIFTGGRIMGVNGIVMDNPPPVVIDPYNGNKFFSIGFEGVANPITIYNAANNLFADFRMAESITGIYWFDLKNSRNNLFRSRDIISQTRILEDSTCWNSYEFLVTADVDGDYIAEKMVTYQNKRFYYGVPAKQGEKTLSGYNQLLSTDVVRNYKLFILSAGAGGTTRLTLDSRFGFAGGNQNSFILQTTTIGVGAIVEIVTSTGAVVVNTAGLKADSFYHIEWFPVQGWKVIDTTGTQGIQGVDGATNYTWVKYADTPTTGMNDLPTGKDYIGIAVNKTSATESATYADYAWSLIRGPQGIQGIQGIQGVQGDAGSSLYTWVKYATTPTTGISDLPTGKDYIGIAVNKTTSTESDIYADYAWSLTRGEQGIQGIQGPAGADAVVLFENRTTDPTSPVTGQAWIRTDL